jgi:hypothetical protein
LSPRPKKSALVVTKAQRELKARPLVRDEALHRFHDEWRQHPS